MSMGLPSSVLHVGALLNAVHGGLHGDGGGKLHYSHIEREEKHRAVERALALFDGPKVEHRVEGSKLGDDVRSTGVSETTRND